MTLVFTEETARLKVKNAQALWNTRDPHKVVQAYTQSSIWRNRTEFFQGHESIVDFLTRKWATENGYRLRKELFAFRDNRIAVQFWYEWFDQNGQWYRTYGLEDWTFAPDGLMEKRQMSANDLLIGEHERWFKDGVDIDQVEISQAHW
eukprot:jgi/Hompol1/76/HPOL_004286-RA